jgi:hypothetical protein
MYYTTVLLLSGILAGAVNFFVSYLELPFPKQGINGIDDDWPKPRSLWIAILGYLVVGIAGSSLTPLIDAIIGGLKGLEIVDNTPKNPAFFNYILFGYALVFGYSTTRLLLSILDSIIKRLLKVELSVTNIKHQQSTNRLPFTNPNPTAQQIIDECEANFETNKSDCSGFVKSVATAFSINLTGQADNIVDQITSSGWTILSDGIDAKNKADDGLFVVAGLKSFDNVPQQRNGHVAIIVSGELAQQKYPTGYWGKYGGVGEKNKTINWAWNRDSRDKVIYSAKPV